MENFDVETLQKMPYSSLKKLAKRNGIKANLKGDSIVAALLSKYEAENFKNMEQEIINSSRKNKENKFNADKTDISETPRRDTYSVETPVNTILPVSRDSMDAMASPILSDIINNSAFGCVTVSRGSERKSKKQKVNFITPAKSPRVVRNSTPYVSLKDRPKTPIPSRVSTCKKISFITPDKSSIGESIPRELRKSRPSTPYPLPSNSHEARKSHSGTTYSGNLRKRVSSAVVKADSEQVDLPSVSEVKTKHEVSTEESCDATTEKSLKIKRTVTASSAATDEKSTKIKRTATPNFKKIHQEAFKKMESIDDYQKRKALNSAKKIKSQSVQKVPVLRNTKKIAKFSGIPFVPSVTSIKGIKLDFSSQHARTVKQLNTVASETTALSQNKCNDAKPKDSDSGAVRASAASQGSERPKRNLKFDLKASLSRKLPYKPHTGPLQPLWESNLNRSILSTSCYHKKDENQSLVAENRNKSRGVLEGVRKNRRFELQMKQRKM